MNSAILPRVAPFALFMACVGLEEGGRFLIERGLLPLDQQDLQYLYPLKIAAVALLLLRFARHYTELEPKQLANLRHLALSVGCGVVVFLLWIPLDIRLNPLGITGGFNPLLFQEGTERILMIAARLAGAVLVVPLMEELFWRSFFIRYLIDQDFTRVEIGRVTPAAFLITALLFGLEHTLFLAGVMAGSAYTLLLIATRSVTHCVLAHAVTNLLLGIHVLATQQWQLW